MKTIAVRGQKVLVAVYEKVAALSGNQNTGRPQLTHDIVEFVSALPENTETKTVLQSASKEKIEAQCDGPVPSFIKVPIEIDEAAWNKAMSVFRFAFDLKKGPQMPYFIRVAGIAYAHSLESQNRTLKRAVREPSAMPLDRFGALSADDKLNTIYSLLLEMRP